MSSTRRYDIGGALLTVASPDAPLAEEHYPDYLPFLTPTAAPAGGPEIEVEAHPGEPRLPPGTRLLLEAGEAWSVHERAGTLFIASRAAPPAARLAWLAAVRPDRRRTTLTCGEGCVVAEGLERRLVAPIRYPLDQILLALGLAGEALIVHAAGVQFGDRGVVLAGPSGAGKTTIARLCAAAGRSVLSDDRVILRRGEHGWRLYGTPWPGEGGFAENRGVPLAAVLLLAKGDGNVARPLPPAALARRLTPLASIPWYDPPSRERCLDLLDALAGALPVCDFSFRPEAEAELALARAVQEAGSR